VQTPFAAVARACLLVYSIQHSSSDLHHCFCLGFQLTERSDLRQQPSVFGRIVQEGSGLFEVGQCLGQYVFFQVIACNVRGNFLIDEHNVRGKLLIDERKVRRKVLIDGRNVPVPIIDDCLDVFEERLRGYDSLELSEVDLDVSKKLGISGESRSKAMALTHLREC
jgi:hypothetical protein